MPWCPHLQNGQSNNTAHFSQGCSLILHTFIVHRYCFKHWGDHCEQNRLEDRQKQKVNYMLEDNICYKDSGERDGVGVGVGLLALENEEDKEGCTEKGIPEKKTSRRGGRELQNSILSAKALRQEYACGDREEQAGMYLQWNGSAGRERR